MDVKTEVEKVVKESGWVTASQLFKMLPFPAPEVNKAIIDLIKENKIERRGRYFHYLS